MQLHYTYGSKGTSSAEHGRGAQQGNVEKKLKVARHLCQCNNISTVKEIFIRGNIPSS